MPRRRSIIPAMPNPSRIRGGAPDRDRPLSDLERAFRVGALGHEADINPGSIPPMEYTIAKLEAIENPTEADKAALKHARAELEAIKASKPIVKRRRRR